MNFTHVNTDIIAEAVKQCIYEASFTLPGEVKKEFKVLSEKESTSRSRETYSILLKNAEIAERERLALCQDCGSTIVFLDIGSEIILEGEFIEDAVNRAVEEAYDEFSLRKSIVKDPLKRDNTGTNTPAFIHTEYCSGSDIVLSVYLKGGGSENMSALKMFRPTAKISEIVEYIASKVKSAGPNPCPPLFLGVGIGGTADVALLNSKKAVLRGLGTVHQDPFYQNLENQIKQAVNNTGVGVLGFGGEVTAVEVYVKEAPAHIATLPVAINMNCHSLRYRTVKI